MWKHATKYEMFRACNQVWGVKIKHATKYEVLKSMQLSMICQKHITKYAVSSACNQIWGVETMQPSMKCQKYAIKLKCWKHATKYDMSKTCNQVWGVTMNTNKYEALKCMQPRGH